MANNLSSLMGSTALTRPKNYVPRQKPNPYTGSATPTVWDPNWRSYTNLNKPPYGPTTIAAFEAMPENLTAVAAGLRHRAVNNAMGVAISVYRQTKSKVTPATVQADAITAASFPQTDVVTAINAAYATEATVLAGIGKTITKQEHVVAAFATLTKGT